MSLARFWSSFQFLNLSKPAGDRILFRSVRGKKIESILEVNVGTGLRCERLLPWIREQADLETIRYAAVDPFETGGGDHVPLKEFHSRLGRLGAKPLPVPNTGNLAAALARVAHTIGAVDLAIFDCDRSELEAAATRAILPRIVRSDSLVLIRKSSAGGLELVAAAEVSSPSNVKIAA